MDRILKRAGGACLAAMAALAILSAPGRAASDGRDLASPSDFGLPVPSPAPELPAAFDRFEPPRHLISGAAPAPGAPAPIIARISKTAGPGELFIASGAGLRPGAEFLVFSQTASGGALLDTAAAWTATGFAAAAAVPSSVQHWSQYMVWPKLAGLVGTPVALNRTEAWWVGHLPDREERRAAVYGRNLSHGNGTTAAWVLLKPAGGPGSWVPVRAVNPYRVVFAIPPETPTGRYEVWAHNGHGGHFGWSGPLTLMVEGPPATPPPDRIFDVRDFGAKGDNRTDDETAIQAALNAAARHPPATVRFPPGVYRISRGFALPDGVSLRGEGRDQSVIKALPGFGGPPDDARADALLFADGASGGNDVTIADLTIDGTEGRGHLHVPIHIRYARNVRLSTVRIRAEPDQFFNLDGIRGLSLLNLDLTGMGGFLGSASQVLIDGCTVRLTAGANSAFTFWGGHEIAVTRTMVADLYPDRPDQASAGRFIVSQPHFGSIRNLYIAENQTTALAPPPARYGDPNAGEQILFEQCCALYTGTIRAAAKDSLTVPPGALPAIRAGLFDAIILAGPGVGQYRRVVATDPASGTLTVSPPWTVVPDPGTPITIAGTATQAVIYHNRLDGKPDYATYDTASSGAHLYGNSSDVIVDGNWITRMRAGVELWAVGFAGAVQLSPVYFNLVVNNRIRDAHDALFVHTMYVHGEVPDSIGHLGNIYRGNQAERLVQAAINIETWEGYRAGAQILNAFEANRFQGLSLGLLDTRSFLLANTRPVRPATPLRETILYRNIFDRGGGTGDTARGVLARPDSTWLSRGNLWRDFPTGDRPEETLQRRVDSPSTR